MRILWFAFAGFFLLISAWFFYDGFVGFPRANEPAAVLERHMKDAKRAQDRPTFDRAAAELNGLKTYSSMDLSIQKGIGIFFAIVGAVFLSLGVWAQVANKNKTRTENAVVT
jgi:hypothetical protein